MLRVSMTLLFSSKNFKTGSAPRRYLIFKFGYFLGLSPFTKAWICGNRPNFHPHTSKWAWWNGVKLSSSVSSWQHCRHVPSSSFSLNSPKLPHALHRRLEENPWVRHNSDDSFSRLPALLATCTIRTRKSARRYHRSTMMVGERSLLQTLSQDQHQDFCSKKI